MNRAKKLTEYLIMLTKQNLAAGDNSSAADFAVKVTDVSYNSKEVAPGTLFICKGAAFKAEYL